MKKLIIIILSLFVIINILEYITPTYSDGIISTVTGKKGNRVIHFYDNNSNTELSYDEVIKYYNIFRYFSKYVDDEEVYFYDGKEIAKEIYDKGVLEEAAKKRKSDLGSIAYFVKSTAEAKETVDKIINNYKIGEFYLEYSPYDNIDWKNVTNYLNQKYRTSNYKQNYYNYTMKGILNPYRFNDVIEKTDGIYEYKINTKEIRITKDQKEVVDHFINDLLPLLKGNESDYDKILASYTYITKTTTYLPDKDYVVNPLEGNTSIYSVFIKRTSVCIGYSIAFSYLMDKLGIDSYIVDNPVLVDLESRQFASNHTYNIVKLNDTWYKIDTTGHVFLGGISNSDLYDQKLNISNTAFDTTGYKTTYNLDYTLINQYLNNAKNMKTTTTKYIRTTTTKPNPPYRTTTTSKTSSKEEKTTTENIIVKTTDKKTTEQEFTTEDYTFTTNKHIIDNDPKIDKYEETNKNNNSFARTILVIIAIILLAILIIYEIKFKEKGSKK